MLVVCFSVFAPVSKSPLDGTFEIGVEGFIRGKIQSITKKENSFEITLQQVAFQEENKATIYFLNKILLYSKESNLYPGYEIKATGTLIKFQKPRNPGEFNFQYYYNSKGISYKMQGETIQIENARKNQILCFLDWCQKSMKRVYDRWLPVEKAGIISAMFLGEKSQIPEDIRRLYQQNGIGHLLAISGLHITLIGMGFYKICIKIIKYKKLSAVLSMGVIVAYGVMTGFSISTNRAVVMTLLGLGAICLGRTYDMLTGIALSGAIILIQSPLEIRNSGFLLSFGAVLGISIISPVLNETIDWEQDIWKRKALRDFLQNLFASISVQLVTMPIILYNFYEVPLYGILINLIVIPLLSLLAGLGLGAGLLGMVTMNGAGIFMGGLYWILELYEWLCLGFGKLPGHSIVTGQPQMSYLVFYYVGLSVILLLWHIFHRKAVFGLMLLLFLFPILPENHGFEIDFLDVGQGDGIYMETEDGVKILMDGGSLDKKNLGKFVLEPFLKSKGCGKVDYVFLSHLDEDHVSGIMELAELKKMGGVQIGKVILGAGVVKDEVHEEVVKKLKEQEIPVGYIKEGSEVSLGKLKIRCLNPVNSPISVDRNDNSLVLEVQYEEFDLLLTGDISESERLVMKKLSKKEYEVLKVSHHGSKYSTSEAFLKRVSPKIAVISCGKNTYGHPHQEVLDRLRASGSQVFITKQSGAVILKYQKGKWTLREFVG